MKKILLLLCFLAAFFVSNAQYPVIQYIGSDSTIVKSRGGLQGRFAPIPFTDTTSANLSRISQYPGALIYTSGVDKYWYRNATTTGWIEFTSSGGSTVNIYNSNGTLTSDRNLDGQGFSLGFQTLSKFWTQSDTVDIELLSTGAKVFNIHNLTETQDTTTYKPMVVDPVTGRVLQSSYWYGGTGGSSSGIVSLGTSAYGLITQNDSTYKVDTALLSTKLWRQKGIDSVQSNVNLKLNITDTANMRVRLYEGSNITITGTYPNLTIASTGGAADTSVLLVDTLYNRLATVINADSIRLKSLRIQEGGVDITPTITDSTISWNITGGGSVTYADSLTVDTLIRGMGVKIYGNSLTYWLNGTAGTPWELQQKSELPVYRWGQSSATINQIMANFDADGGKPSRHYGHIFEMGRNNLTSGAYLTLRANLLPALARIADTMAAYGNNKWVFNSITNGGGEGIGTALYDTLIAVNNTVAALYPTHYVDVRSYLVANYDPAQPKDLSNHAQDIPPYSLRINSLSAGYIDSVHFNAIAYRLWANILDSVAYNWYVSNDAGDQVISANKTIKLLSGQMPTLAAKKRIVVGNTIYAFAPNEYLSPKTIQIGNDREPTDTTSGGNTLVGIAVADSLTNGYWNTVGGGKAAQGLKTGYGNTVSGYNAGNLLKGGYLNSYFGLNAGVNGVDVAGNAAGGNGALQTNSAGNFNATWGASGMSGGAAGSFNSNIGYGGLYNIAGSNNTNGGVTGLYNYTGSGATNFGGNGSYSMTSGTDITTVGFNTNRSNQTGSRIATLGSYTNYADGVANYSVSDIAMFGAWSGYRNRGSNQIFIGPRAVQDTVTGSNNIAIGDSLELPDKTASYQMTIANVIYGKGTWGRGTSVGTAKIGIRNNAPSYNLDITGTLRATDSVRYSGLPTGTKAYFAMMDANGVLHRADTAGWGGGGGGGGTTYKIGTYNSQTINGDGASIVGDSIYMQAFSAESPGLVPAGGSGTTYLRGDGTWQTVTAGAAGSNRQITFNSNGSASGTDSLNWTASRLQTTNGTRIAVNGASVAAGATDAALMVRSIDNVTGGIAIYTNANYATELRMNSTSIQASSGLTITSVGNDLKLNSSKVYAGGSATATSTLQSAGSFATAYVAKSSSYTATISDCVIEVTATGQTITLPTAVGITGRQYTVKLTASGTGTVGTTSSQTIDGSTTYSLSAQYKYVTVQSNGANWNIIANN